MEIHMLPAHFHDVYLRSYLVKNTACAPKESNTKYKNATIAHYRASYEQKHLWYGTNTLIKVHSSKLAITILKPN